MYNLQLPLVSLILSTMILIVFSVKAKFKNNETEIYNSLVWCTFLIAMFEFSTITCNYLYPETILIEVFNRLATPLIIFWLTFILLYVYSVSYGTSKLYKKIKWSILSINVIAMTFVQVLPIELINNDNIMTASGPAVNLIYIMAIIYMIIIMVITFLNIKKNSGAKFIPIFSLVALLLIALILRIYVPTLVFVSMPLTLISMIMYFTIENPDVKMIGELNIAKDAADKANKAKTEFLSNMSHEIRTPLNAIVGFSNMISSETTVDGCKENAGYIVEASQTLLEIVNGILDISKIEANKMEIVNKHYDLTDEITDLVKLIKPRIGEKPIKMTVNLADDIPGVLNGDLGKVKQILTNILTNAIKYTEYGEIVLTVSCINENKTSSISISVRDTGRGIKTEKINSLFTKFDRLEEDKNTTIEGTGLGLAITKSLVELMGGKVVVQSEYGEGSIFSVFLKQEIVKMEKVITYNSEDSKENLRFDGKKILVVDDNLLNLKITEKILITYGINPTLVNSGKDCIKLIKARNDFDLILMDDMMPELSGTETLEILKRDPDFRTKTIVLTANALAGMEEKYLEAGFDDYLAKPLEKIELQTILNNFLNIGKINFNDKNVLILDDNKVNVKIIAALLSKYGFNICESFSGKDALEKASLIKFDLAFIDYMMPDMNGIEVLQELKKIKNFNTTAVVVTADIIESEEKFLKAGFDEYVSKPVNREILDTIITTHVKDN